MFGFIDGESLPRRRLAPRHPDSLMTKKPQQPEPQPNADDRNIVPLDSSYEGGTLEDRLFLFWTENRRLIVAVSMATVVVLLGWGLLAMLQNRREARIATEYQEATTMEDKLAFAERAAPHSMAGAALLEVADHQFSEGNYEEAAATYSKAVENLVGLPLAGRASVGRGIALARADQKEAALAHLEQVAANAGFYDNIRGEAHYHAAALAMDLGRPEVARRHIEEIQQLASAPLWAGRAISLSRSLPEEEPAPAPTAAAAEEN